MPNADHIEREAKFLLAPDHQPCEFSQALAQAGYVFRPLGTIEITDTYFDTPAFALLRHGIALRVRFGVGAYEVGIKAVTGRRVKAVLARLDLAFALPVGADPHDATTWPRAIFTQLAETVVVKPKELRPVVVLHQTRQKSHVSSPAADAQAADQQPAWVAEWSVDEVRVGGSAEQGARGDSCAHAPDESTTTIGTHFRELEVELLPARKANGLDTGAAEASIPGDIAGFDTLVARLQAQHALTPTFDSKFLRALECTIAAMHGGWRVPPPTMTLADAGRLLLHQQLFQILLNEHGVRVGKQARYVHDMRVAIRRARAALQLMTSTLPAATLASHRQGLKRLSRALGAVRDLDVALANLRAFMRSQPEADRRGFKRLRAELKARRVQARAALLELLDGKKHRKFLEELVAFCAAPAVGGTPVNAACEIPRTQLRHTLPSIVLAAFEAVRAYEVITEQGGDATGAPPLETYHALRIAVKYLRYLLEFTQHLLGREGESLIKQLRALQEHLGELNDAYVEDQRLAAWDEELPQGDALHLAIASRRAELAARMVELQRQVPLANFVALHNRRSLMRALARI